MKVAKNTLIKKALESLDAEKYSGVFDSLHQVTALMFSENPKEPAMIISSFRKENNTERPLLTAAFINGDVFVGNDQLKALTQIKTKNELIGEVIGLLQSPIQRVLGALQNKDAAKAEEATPAAEVVAEAPVADAPPVVDAPVAETPETETPSAEAAPEAPAADEAKGEDETPQA
jgi:large subunit ribosomal protein L10